MEKSKERLDVGEIFQKSSINSEELIFLLQNKEEVDFLLIDIREMEENSAFSIKDTDILFPISKIHLYPNVLEELRHKQAVLYCRTGSRTTYLLQIMQKMGFEKVSHLEGGIVNFGGVIVSKKAPPIVY